MSLLRPQSSRSGRTNDQRPALVLGQTQDLVDAVDPTLPHTTVSHARRGCVPGQDPFAYYTAFLNTESSSSNASLNGADQHGDGGTWCQPRAEAQSTVPVGYVEQQQNKPRTVPGSVADRLANRSNGAPLATIVEQGSVSTLNSHGSLLSAGRFPSIRAVENASPVQTSHRHSRSLDDIALNRIQEEDQDRHTFCNDAKLNIQPKEGRGGKSKSYHAKSITAGSVSLDDQRSPIPQLPELSPDMDPKGLKGLLRGVWSKVRSNTRSRSLSSSNADVPELDQWCDVSSSAQTDRKATMNPDSQGSPFTSASTMLLRPQATNGSSPQVTSKHSADGSASQSHVDSTIFKPETVPVEIPLPPIPNLSCRQLGKEALPSACSVPLQPRDAGLDHIRHTATTVLSRSRDELVTRYTPDGAFAQPNDGGSLDDFARNASRNASFCSTMSTSYSGTVLGIDLDVQHEFLYTTRRSVTPVWFSPTEPVKTHNPSKRALPLEGAKPLRPRSMTSCALTSLLPIAAAEGIVQQNLTTPQLTFYSPSGNLIQAQSASSTPTPTSSSRSRSLSDSYFSGAPTTTTSYYNSASLTSAQSALCAAVTNPGTRPALVPLTITPQSIAPLPQHLRHHHNYHRVDKSRIGSMCDSEIMLPSQVVTISDSQVPGCGGVVRPPNPNPHSGIPQSPPKRSMIGRSMYCLRLKEANRLAIDTSFLLRQNSSCKWRGCHIPAQNFRKKGKTLQKRRVPHMVTVPEKDVIGPAAGHALRVCFCQPYDGVGRQTSEVGCGAAATTPLGERRDESCVSPTGLREATPNARVVAAANGKGKGRARRDSAVSVGVVGH